MRVAKEANGLKLSRYIIETPPFVDDHHSGREKLIIFASRSAKIRAIDTKSWATLKSGDFASIPPPIINDLRRIKAIVNSEENEFEAILARNEQAAEESNLLYIVVQPTAFCQLGCGYCGQAHTRKQLSNKDQELLVERIRKKLSSGRYKALCIGWFGGEPFAAINVIERLTRKFTCLCEEFDCHYYAKTSTNGLLLDHDQATHIVNELRITQIDVTLDGAEEFHDQRRMFKTGKPSFRTIFSNVVALAHRDDLDIELSVRINVDARNKDGMIPLLQDLARARVQNRISVYFAHVYDWGNQARKDGGASPLNFAEWELGWFREMKRLGFETDLMPKPKKILCMAMRPNSDLVDAYGTLFNCTEVSYVPSYIGHNGRNRYALGHLESGENPKLRRILGNFYEEVRQGKYPCFTCTLLPVCGGGCPKLWKEGAIPCPSFKSNIVERLQITYEQVPKNPL